MAQAVASYLREKRYDWQNELAAFRNYLEHKDDIDPTVYSGRYEVPQAEKLFGGVWRTIADLLSMLVSLHLPPGILLVEIPPNERDPVHPRRFRFAVQGFPSERSHG